MIEGTLFKSRIFQHPQVMLFPAKEKDLWLQVKVRESKCVWGWGWGVGGRQGGDSRKMRLEKQVSGDLCF